MKTALSGYHRHTSILSGLMSACMTLHFRRRVSARKSCCAYARTARMFSPTSLPKRFTTSRRFILYDGNISTISEETKDRSDLSDSKTKHRWPRCSKVRSRQTTCFLSSGSDCLSLFRICTSFCPALYLSSSEHIKRGRGHEATNIDSWLRIILIATSLPASPVSL